MSRRSRRKQNQRRQLRNGKEKEKTQLKNCILNITSSLNGLGGTRIEENFLIENFVGISRESQSDPDSCYELFSGLEGHRSKSDSELNKLLKYSFDVRTYDCDPTRREGSQIESFYQQRAINTCVKLSIMNDAVSSISCSENVINASLKNRGRTFSLYQISPNHCPSSRGNVSEVVAGHSGENINRSEKKDDFDSRVKNESEHCDSACERNMKVYEEAMELPEKSCSHLQDEIIRGKKGAISINYGNEDGFFQVFENERNFETDEKNSLCFQENEEENKIFMECTKTEKQMLNCSLLNSEPKNKSTPIMRTARRGSRQLSSPNLSFIKSDSNISSTSSVIKNEEFFSCCKEFLSRDESGDEDDSLYRSFYASCREMTNESMEAGGNRRDPNVAEVVKFVSRDAGVQCDLLAPTNEKLLNKYDEINVERKTSYDASSEGDLLMRSALNEFEHKLNSVAFSPTVNVANDVLWGVNEISSNDVDVSAEESDQATFDGRNFFKTFSKLLSKSSVQKIFRVLSVLPMEKLLEFFCLTFSIPLIETMAISISVTKVMNVLSTGVSFSNFNKQIRNFGSKAVDYIKAGLGSFIELFVTVQVDEVTIRRKCSCFCDVKKYTDLEKRLKNLENELTKFQIFDKEMEKLREIAKSVEETAAAGTEAQFLPPHPPRLSSSSVRAPDIPAPPPPPPPPLPPLPLLPPTPNSLATAMKTKKSLQTQNVTTRPSITVEDLQKVTLRKVVANEKPSYDKKGPVVSLEMLRSVKLRSSSRKKSDTCSPTRTPTSRDRLRKMKSPAFRSSSRSGERKPRFSNIPLSQILSMDDGYQFVDGEKSNRE